MSALVLDAARRFQAGEGSHEPLRRPSRPPHLVLVPTGPDAVAARRTPPAMRLTTAGRLVVAVLVAAVVMLLAVVLAGRLASATQEPRVITVQRGQTLWGIAARELPDLPVTEGIVELQVANSLSTSQIHVGQRLVVPTP